MAASSSVRGAFRSFATDRETEGGDENVLLDLEQAQELCRLAPELMTPSFTRADVEAAFDRARSHSERLLDFVEFENFLMDLAVQRYPKEESGLAFARLVLMHISRIPLVERHLPPPTPVRPLVERLLEEEVASLRDRAAELEAARDDALRRAADAEARLVSERERLLREAATREEALREALARLAKADSAARAHASALEARDAALQEQRAKEASLASDVRGRDAQLTELRAQLEAARKQRKAADVAAEADAKKRSESEAALRAKAASLEAELRAKEEELRRREAASAEAQAAAAQRDAAHADELARVRATAKEDLERMRGVATGLQQSARKLQAEIDGAAAPRRRLVACASAGWLCWIAAAALLWLLFALGIWSAAGTVRRAKAVCAALPASRSRDLVCVSESGCLEVFGATLPGVCAPPAWLVDPAAASAPAAAAPAPEHGVWYTTDSDLALGCQSRWGCGAAAVGM